jgi:monofunctional biosynthetic peptidoglycan transglycosylase
VRRIGRVALALLAFGFGCAAYAFLTLPDVRVLRDQNPPTTAFIELRAREADARGVPARRIQRWVPYSRISQNLKRAVLVAEDSAFWQHDGVDYEQLKDAMEVNLERMEFVRGASTITQQLAKNLYLSPSKNPIRKLRELLITRRLEAELSKQRILEIYLNVIEWGDGIYGAEAAARQYFGISAAQLGPSESALLAGALVNARLLDPGHPTARLRRRQQMILRRMGGVTPPASTADASAPIDPVQELPPATPGPPESLPGEVIPVGKIPQGRGGDIRPDGSR